MWAKCDLSYRANNGPVVFVTSTCAIGMCVMAIQYV